MYIEDHNHHNKTAKLNTKISMDSSERSHWNELIDAEAVGISCSGEGGRSEVINRFIVNTHAIHTNEAAWSWIQEFDDAQIKLV